MANVFGGIKLKYIVYLFLLTIIIGCQDNGYREKDIGEGVIYKGYVVNGEPHGKGSAVGYSKNKKEILRIEGEFENGKIVSGTIVLPDGIRIYGKKLVNGMICGYGEVYDPLQKATFKGIYENSKPVKIEKIVYDDGKIYTGNTKGYIPHGQGVMVFPDNTMLVGEFVDGYFIGK